MRDVYRSMRNLEERASRLFDNGDDKEATEMTQRIDGEYWMIRSIDDDIPPDEALELQEEQWDGLDDLITFLSEQVCWTKRSTSTPSQYRPPYEPTKTAQSWSRDLGSVF